MARKVDAVFHRIESGGSFYLHIPAGCTYSLITIQGVAGTVLYVQQKAQNPLNTEVLLNTAKELA